MAPREYPTDGATGMMQTSLLLVTQQRTIYFVITPAGDKPFLFRLANYQINSQLNARIYN